MGKVRVFLWDPKKLQTLTLLLHVYLLLFCRQKQVIRWKMEGKYQLMCQIAKLKQQEIEKLWKKLGYV